MADGGWGRELTRCKRLFGIEEIGTVQAFAGGAAFACAGMTTEVFMIVSPVAIVAEIGFVEESSERIASVVMPVFLDEPYDLASGHSGVSGKDDHVRWINGHDFDLMVG